MRLSSSRPNAVLFARWYLFVVVVGAGVATLMLQMVAWRMLAPFYGTGQPVWAAVIGATLVFLAVGYQLGGMLADRTPQPRRLYQLVYWSGVIVGLVPGMRLAVLGPNILRTLPGVVGDLVGSLVGMASLFVLPLTLLAAVNPFVLRLTLRAKAQEEYSGPRKLALARLW
jgi:hypothetical protein